MVHRLAEAEGAIVDEIPQGVENETRILPLPRAQHVWPMADHGRRARAQRGLGEGNGVSTISADEPVWARAFCEPKGKARTSAVAASKTINFF